MPVTEIYSCKDGQKLKAGRLDLSHDITDKDQARADALRRCKLDPSLRRIAYYAVSDDGRYRNFFTYTNTTAGSPKKRPAGELAVRRRRPAPRPAEPRGLLARLRKALGLS